MNEKLANSLRALQLQIAEVLKELDGPKVDEKPPTLEEVRQLLAALAHEGYRDKVKALVAKFGGDALSSYKNQPDVLLAIKKEAEVMRDG